MRQIFGGVSKGRQLQIRKMEKKIQEKLLSNKEKNVIFQRFSWL